MAPWLLPLLMLQASPAEPAVTTARADGKGQIEVHLVYLAEHSCVSFDTVKEGHPPSIDAPKRTPTITVVLNRGTGPHCKPKLTRVEHTLTIADRPGALSVEVLYVDKAGVFVRSSRPPIERPGAIEQEIE